MKILVTGFEPFGGEAVNPSWLAVSQIPDQVKGAEVIKKQLPVEWFRALDILERNISPMLLCLPARPAEPTPCVSSA